jgi:indolepyruvate ferredoxin oxidoreductase
MADASLTLDDRYLRERGAVYLTGLQALVRLPIDQARRDRRAGLRVGTFISGYPGSPLGGYDLALKQARDLLAAHDIRHVPGANEEIAASAISGTQMLDHYPHSEYDGVVGLWYGKGPGIDRSGDALKHGNFAGTSQHGAVVVLSGEDHEAKSSTMPFQDDYAFVGHGMPILYPASVAEFLTLGLHGVALSRFSGLWVAMKLVNALCDGGEIVEINPDEPSIVLPELGFKKSTDFTFFPGINVETERRLYQERHPAALAFVRANKLNRIEVGPSAGDRLGIITAGKSYADVRQAFADFGLDDAALASYGIRLLRIGMLYPLDQEIVRTFAEGLEEIIVVEEKRGFLESQVKEALCGAVQSRLTVVGKLDEQGQPLFPVQGGMDADIVAECLGPRLLGRYVGVHQGIMDRLSALRAIRSRPYEILPTRTPNYCSGCPHNTSTRLLEGQVAWGSPGCHSFAEIIEQPERHIVSMTQLGGEGLPWIGLEHYTDLPHLVQNVGDGSLFHSSYLNIRFAVAAGANMTFKILYNGFVANTGAQEAVGMKSVPDLTRLLELEGVRRIAVVTKEPKRYRDAELGPRTQVRPVDDLAEVQRGLADESGVTVMIYDETCANERRRRQKRGKLPAPNRFVLINEEVCENCGHCGALTNCMSLHKVDTELGPKTQIHQSSCNQDYSCLGGDCPSFVTVETTPGTGLRKPAIERLQPDAVREPPEKASAAAGYRVYIPGVGGTGVITINALLSYAAWMEGKYVLSYDQTGAAQKWGPVLSSLIIADGRAALHANKVAAGQADLYLALDLMAAATRVNLDRCDPARSVAVINTDVLPSGEMIRDVWFSPQAERLEDQVARFTRSDRRVSIDARRLAETLFGDYMATNLCAVGAAYQAGLLPLSAESIEAAIRLNGVQVDQNLQAFRYGRLAQAEPGRVQALIEPGRRVQAPAPMTDAATRLIERCAGLDPEAQRLLAYRVPELIAYQNAAYAEQYLEFVLKVASRAGSGEITHAVIRNLYKLMAYKDEYEVARLQLKPGLQEQAQATFASPVKLVYNLHPPLLRALGMKKKLALGPWFRPALGALRAMKGLRGTPLDPFGYAHVRREERRLIGWYRGLVERALARLTAETAPAVLEIACLPDAIRGYEEIKLRTTAAAERRATAVLENLDAGRTPQAVEA